MDERRQREHGGSADGVVVESGATPGSVAFLDLPRVLLDPCPGFLPTVTTALQWCLEHVPFDRAFFALRGEEPPPGGGSGPSASPLSFRVLASRRRETGNWGEAGNPEFALRGGIVNRAMDRPGASVVCDGLQAAGEEARCVLCRGFSLDSSSRGVVYLDRSIGLEGISEEERERFERIVDGWVPALGRAWLAERVANLERERQEWESEADEPEEESGGDGSAARSDLDIDPGLESRYGIVGRHESLQRIFRVIEKVRDSDLNVCIFGESGTGKELVARAIHDTGCRSRHQFVSENCGAIAENLLESELFGHMMGSFTGASEDKKGLFEVADGGTLFLDEIGDMPESMQRKLLRVLQDGSVRPIGAKSTVRVDVRVICSSHRDLRQLVREGTFRDDLYYRLNVIQIEVPPLRERRGDIPQLIHHFTARFQQEEGVRRSLGESAIRALCQYGWPGNVRELRNVLRRALLTSTRRVVTRREVLSYLSETPAATCLGEDLRRDDEQLLLRIPLRESFNEIIEECEKLVIVSALRESGWNKSRVTKNLGIPRQSLYNKIARYDIQRDDSPM